MEAFKTMLFLMRQLATSPFLSTLRTAWLLSKFRSSGWLQVCITSLSPSSPSILSLISSPPSPLPPLLFPLTNSHTEFDPNFQVLLDTQTTTKVICNGRIKKSNNINIQSSPSFSLSPFLPLSFSFFLFIHYLFDLL